MILYRRDGVLLKKMMHAMKRNIFLVGRKLGELFHTCRQLLKVEPIKSIFTYYEEKLQKN